MSLWIRCVQFWGIIAMHPSVSTPIGVLLEISFHSIADLAVALLARKSIVTWEAASCLVYWCLLPPTSNEMKVMLCNTQPRTEGLPFHIAILRAIGRPAPLFNPIAGLSKLAAFDLSSLKSITHMPACLSSSMKKSFISRHDESLLICRSHDFLWEVFHEFGYFSIKLQLRNAIDAYASWLGHSASGSPQGTNEAKEKKSLSNSDVNLGRIST